MTEKRTTWGRPVRLLVGLVLCFLLGMGTACRESSGAGETESGPLAVMTLEIEVDTAVQALISRVQVQAKGAGDYGSLAGSEAAVYDLSSLSEQDWPLTVRLEPEGGDASRVYSVLVKGLDGGGETVAWGRLISGFEGDEEVYGHLMLGTGCAADACSERHTCRQGTCQDAQVAPLGGTGGTQEDGGVADDGPDDESTGGVIESDPCLVQADRLDCGHGRCVVDGVDVACLCDVGYGGARCDELLDPCVEHACQNAGECVVQQGQPLCLCPTGFEGEACETQVGGCDPNPCLHGGTCSETAVGFECACPSGFSAANCGVNRDDCAGVNACGPSACVDEVNGYHCDCVDGSSGKTCLPWADSAGWDDYGLWAGFKVAGVTVRMRRVTPGTFTMGSPLGENERFDNELQREVTLSRPYWVAETEATQALWTKVMGSNPSQFVEAQRPVETVSWLKVQEFLIALEERAPGLSARLLTEAEWEYACRAGSKEARYGALEQVGWYQGNSGSETHTVALKRPNAFGLFDMLGNVWEWCADYYMDYPEGPATDPKGAESGRYPVMRGGAWYSGSEMLRAAARGNWSQDGSSAIVGFRLARDD